ncbi:hypothetical protein SAMN05444673_3353 [Bacillus sp. OV166]|uniref:hypothetical protein n=1 Tax=Bacillus sp. OV166 TaxID=1882763 RepID=UPI000A2AE2CE|nr:hypothetical protein [Bacillus sp. OV166]SMQ78306.1 hypothetical protein SAMN05444673_3353 [Bacillus sp. OV166]
MGFTISIVPWEEFEKLGFPEHEVKATWEKLFDTEWLEAGLKNGLEVLKMINCKALLQESRWIM